ncbi:CDH26 isoform 6, partial [Pongo abelii]
MKPLIWMWSDVEGQRLALLICTAAAGPTQGVKGYGELFEPRGVKNIYSTPAYPDATMHGQLLAPVERRMAETLNQKLHVA